MSENKNGDALVNDLQENIDYLYCPVCKEHVPCIRTDTGYWEVTCPGCIGECSLCQCYLARFCFGRREEFPPLPPPQENQ
ncbi:MAG: hypothetical protein FVQ80_00990 [Planctomycetes bacterium]|nr:hypothetical protein [Planctomycetota bacterium]